MKILKRDKNYMQLKTENLDDLWCLSYVIDNSDLIKGKTERKIKIGEGDNVKVVRKTVTLSLNVNKVQFVDNTLRVTGTVQHGTEDIPTGAHHTITLTDDCIFSLDKKWASYQEQKIAEATKPRIPDILAIIFDREEALFYMLKSSGPIKLANIKGNVAKKGEETQTSNFYKEMATQLKDYFDRYKPFHIIVASPSFFKDYLMKELPEELKKVTTTATTSSVGPGAAQELLKRPELKEVLQKNKSREELALVDSLLKALSDNLACYGPNEVQEQAMQGNVKTLLITDTFLRDSRESDTFDVIESILKQVEQTKGIIHIISTKDSVKKLNGITGIAGVLRWKLSS